MKESVIRKLEGLLERYEEVQALMGEPSVISDQERFRNLNKEYSQLEDVVSGFLRFQQVSADLQAVLEMLDGDDAEMRAMAQEEVQKAEQKLPELEHELKVMLLPSDPLDEKNTILEISTA